MKFQWDYIISKIPIFFTRNFGKRNPFWISGFEHVHYDWAMYFLTKHKLAFLISHFDRYFWLVISTNIFD